MEKKTFVDVWTDLSSNLLGHQPNQLHLFWYLATICHVYKQTHNPQIVAKKQHAKSQDICVFSINTNSYSI